MNLLQKGWAGCLYSPGCREGGCPRKPASGMGGSRKHRRVEGGCADYFLNSYSRPISSRGKAAFPCRAVPGALSSRYLLRRYASLRRRLCMPAPRYLLRRYPSLLVRGASRPRDSTHLPHHAQLVEVVPAFHYLAFIREAEEAYPAQATGLPVGAMPLNSP